ncbi:MAG: hypothetical protein OHK0038_10920 [Flammeovirgaceae bacterium]
MQKRLFIKLYVGFLLVFLPLSLSFAQKIIIQDTTKVKISFRQRLKNTLDSLWTKSHPTGLRLGFDPLWQVTPLIGSNSLSSPTDAWEINGDLILFRNRLILTGSYGFIESKRTDFTNNKFFQASFNGYFSRLGIDYNIIAGKTQYDAVYLGIRFSQTTFHNKLLILYSEDYWKDNLDGTDKREENFYANNVKANWTSIVLGFKVNIFKGLYAGIEGRIHLKPSISNQPKDFKIFEVPAYGLLRENTNSRYGYGYFIQYRIPLWKS